MHSTRGSSIDDALDIQQEILRHLAARPGHGATWEEILEWWLMERAIERESRRVQSALEALVTEGRLRRRRDPRGRTRYEIASDGPASPAGPAGPADAGDRDTGRELR